MRYMALLGTIFLALAASGPARAGDKPLTLRWFGQACFLLTSPGGTAVLMDPFGAKVGYPAPSVKADAVTVSHEHGDHNNAAAAQGQPKVIRGLTESGWAEINEQVGDVRIRSVAADHDAEQGQKRGRDTIFVFETGGITVVHLGDLGRVLTEEQVKQIGKTDVLLVPVGGYYTIDATAAGQVVEQLQPRLVVPMHYKTAATPQSPIAPVDEFLKGKARVERKKGNELAVGELPAETSIVVLDYQP